MRSAISFIALLKMREIAVPNKAIGSHSLIKWFGKGRTKSLRPSECNSLLSSCARSHKAVGVQSISRWIRGFREMRGARKLLFSPLHARHASTSLAAKRESLWSLLSER